MNAYYGSAFITSLITTGVLYVEKSEDKGSGASLKETYHSEADYLSYWQVDNPNAIRNGRRLECQAICGQKLKQS